mmetsp:Transcript_16885/g.30273  ORF Transcript_16885/g.30273 Transcript_16885/m.30273 type:complete len:281 (-) Transcript_16885:1148-1990(-)
MMISARTGRLVSGSHKRRTKNADPEKTYVWWKLLCGIATTNILLWIWTYANTHQDQLSGYRKFHLILSGIYTFVCAYRSVLPRIDLERYCLFDTQFSSVVLGRSAATVAEISFAIQIALLIHEWSVDYDHPVAKTFSFFIPPMLTLAQCFCWMGVVTKNHVFHAIEESLWAIAFTGILAVTAVFAYEGYDQIYRLALVGAVMSTVYVAFMVTVDVPMYLGRWRREKIKKVQYTSPIDGFWDAWSRRHVTDDWQVWKSEVAWLTGYFSLAVWTSIAINHFP